MACKQKKKLSKAMKGKNVTLSAMCILHIHFLFSSLAESYKFLLKI